MSLFKNMFSSVSSSFHVFSLCSLHMILLDLCKVREQIDAKVAEWREEGKALILGVPARNGDWD